MVRVSGRDTAVLVKIAFLAYCVHSTFPFHSFYNSVWHTVKLSSLKPAARTAWLESGSTCVRATSAFYKVTTASNL